MTNALLKTNLALALTAGLLLFCPGTSLAWGPWSTSRNAPVLLTEADRDVFSSRERLPGVHSIAGTPFLWLIRIHQKYITHVDGDRCPMYPTCSQYSVEAIRKHGPFIGIVMTSDRLLHEADERRYAPAIRVGNRYRFHDPVENNDFWWYAE